MDQPSEPRCVSAGAAGPGGSIRPFQRGFFTCPALTPILAPILLAPTSPEPRRNPSSLFVLSLIGFCIARSFSVFGGIATLFIP